MARKQKPSRFFSLHPAVSIACGALILAGGCRRDTTGEPRPPDLAPFIALAKNGDCADTRNRLFLIDGALVFWDRAGQCADAAYASTLYGGEPSDILCDSHDSIAGPMRGCPKPAYEDLFDVIVEHLDEPDLGLGPPHTVELVEF
jgi:hypothetical protein